MNANSSKDDPLFLDIKEAAKRTGLSTYFIRNCIKSGEAPSIMCGAKYKVNMPAFLRWLDQKSGISSLTDETHNTEVHA